LRFSTFTLLFIVAGLKFVICAFIFGFSAYCATIGYGVLQLSKNFSIFVFFSFAWNL